MFSPNMDECYKVFCELREIPQMETLTAFWITEDMAKVFTCYCFGEKDLRYKSYFDVVDFFDYARVVEAINQMFPDTFIAYLPDDNGYPGDYQGFYDAIVADAELLASCCERLYDMDDIDDILRDIASDIDESIELDEPLHISSRWFSEVG